MIHLLIFLAACIVLVKSSDGLLRALTKVSAFFGMSEFIIGFVVMSVSTSLPELFIGIMSGIKGVPELALGTIIGSNIANLTVIIGIVSILGRGIKIKSSMIHKDLMYMVIIIFIPILLMADNYVLRLIGIPGSPGLSRIDGIILVSVYLIYLWKMSGMDKKSHHLRSSRTEAVKNILLMILFFALLIISSEFAVRYSQFIALDMGISSIFVGMFILGIGSNLPDLSMLTKAVIEHHQDLAMGELVGSVVMKSTLVIGLTAIIAPITSHFALFLTTGLYMIVIAFVFFTLAESGKELTWKEGIGLMMLYFFFIMVQFYTVGA